MTIKAGQVCKVTAWGKLVPDDALNAQSNERKLFADYPSAERGDLVVAVGGFKATGKSGGFIQVLHPKEGIGWMSTKYLEPLE